MLNQNEIFVDLTVTSSQTPQSIPQQRTRQPRPGVQRSEYKAQNLVNLINSKLQNLLKFESKLFWKTFFIKLRF